MSHSRILLTAIAVGVIALNSAGGQTPTVAVALAHLTSSVDTVRYEAMRQLRQAATKSHTDVCAPAATSAIKQSLIEALARENARVYDPAASLPEAETELHAELIGCIAALHDARAARALANALDSGMGATNGLLGLGGDVAAPELAAILSAARPRTELRMAAADVAGQITAPNSRVTMSASSRSQIRSGLIATLGDPHGDVRGGAVIALRSFPDEEVKKLMVRIAEADTDRVDKAGRRLEGAAPAARAWLRSYSAVATRVSP